MTTTKNIEEETTVKNNETENEIEAINEFEIEDVVEEVEVEVEVDTNEYPATDVVDLENEYNALKAKIANDTATEAEEERFDAIRVQRKAQRTGKSIAEVTKATTANANAIQTDELEGSRQIAMDNFIATIGGPSRLAEEVAMLNDIAIGYGEMGQLSHHVIEAGTVETATGKFLAQWSDVGKLTLANQRRYYANQLLLLDWVEREVIAKTGVPKGKIEGTVVRNDAGEITIGESTAKYEAKVSGGTNNVNRTGTSVSTKLPTGATLHLVDTYTVNVPGYGDVVVEPFANVGIRGLFDAKKVATGAFKEDNVLRNQGPFKQLCLAYKNLGYYDAKLGKLSGSGTSYDSTLQKALMQVGVNDNYALAQRIVIKSEGNDDITVAEFDAKIKGSIA